MGDIGKESGFRLIGGLFYFKLILNALPGLYQINVLHKPVKGKIHRVVQIFNLVPGFDIQFMNLSNLLINLQVIGVIDIGDRFGKILYGIYNSMLSIPVNKHRQWNNYNGNEHRKLYAELGIPKASIKRVGLLKLC